VSNPDLEPEITMIDAIARLRADGFTHDFSAHDGRLRCGSCGAELDPADVEVVVSYRFEGESDPDDEAAVFGVRCVDCDVTGVYVVAYANGWAPETGAVPARRPMPAASRA